MLILTVDGKSYVLREQSITKNEIAEGFDFWANKLKPGWRRWVVWSPGEQIRMGAVRGLT